MKEINIKGKKIIDLSNTIEPNIPVPVGFAKLQIDLFLKLEGGFGPKDFFRYSNACKISFNNGNNQFYCIIKDSLYASI